MNIILEFDLKLVNERSLAFNHLPLHVSAPSIPSPWGNNSIKLLLKLIIFFKVNREQISFQTFTKKDNARMRGILHPQVLKKLSTLYNFVALNFCFRLLLS